MSASPHTDALSFFEGIPPQSLARAFGTPLYVYSERLLRENCRVLKNLTDIPGFAVNYSVKANANPLLLRIIREEGLVVDAMSPGELAIDLAAGFQPHEILYISNNTRPDEMANAIAHGVLMSVDSLSQLDLYGKLNPGGRVLVRFNPGIGEGHSDKVITAGKKTKFGIAPGDMDSVCALLNQHKLTLVGINQHIGSLFMQPDGYLAACRVLLDIADQLPAPIRKNLSIIDFGGGFGIPYHKRDCEEPLDLARLGKELGQILSEWRTKENYTGRFLIEPGRFVMAEACVLLGRVTAIKDNAGIHFSGTDIGFNVLMRPVLYDSYHEIEVYPKKPGPREERLQTITGNICESGDILAKDRTLPALLEGDLIGVLDAGAYGFSMSSNYTQRFRPCEVLIKNGGARCIRHRETEQDLLRPFEGLL
ncbi:MAG: diaminopimelate decarboxylase [Desulfovibrionaceae bacterium]|nr:diaminopimelate decarboxylase [Desulfovibrionaceae bacterium]